METELKPITKKVKTSLKLKVTVDKTSSNDTKSKATDKSTDNSKSQVKVYTRVFRRKADESKPLATVTVVDKIKSTEPSAKGSEKEFSPITSQSLQCVLNVMEQLALQPRLVLLVFDDLFSKHDLTFNDVKSILHPLVRHIDFNCLLIRTDLTLQMPNLAQAYAKGFKVKNQAYVICPLGFTEEELRERADKTKIMYGIMTIDCVVNSLKKETFLIKSDYLAKLLNYAETVPTGDENMKPRLSGPARNNTLTQGNPVKSSTISQNGKSAINKDGKQSKRNGDPATIKDGMQSKRKKQSDSIKGNDKIESFEAMLLKKVDGDAKRSVFVSAILPDLIALGDVVLRVDNLPANLSISALNIMLGCCTLAHKQVVAFYLRDRKQLDTIGLYIAIKSDNEDMNKILRLHNQVTSSNKKLQVKRTTFKLLESHLLKDPAFRLKNDRISPFNVIGYGNENR